MSTYAVNSDLKVNLANPLSDTNGAYESLKVTGTMDRTMEISLRRTVRVPDNQTTHGLPPDCGHFPIYNVLDFATRLPSKLVAKGGVFVPIYQREAMWIKFKASRLFVIKVFTGGINAVSGEPKIETEATLTRRKQLLARNGFIQDYIVAPSQLWLDGIASKDGKVMQFVAAPTGSGYSVESQITGSDTIAGIQFEIVPASDHYLEREYRVPEDDPFETDFVCKHKPYEELPNSNSPIPLVTIQVKTLTGKTIMLQVMPSSQIWELKAALEDDEGIPMEEQRLVFQGKQLEDYQNLAHYNIHEKCTIHLIMGLRGGGSGPALDSEADLSGEMAVAVGGSIKQVIVADQYPTRAWATGASIMFNLQLLDATLFPKMLGIAAPSTPINATTYAECGYPFFSLSEQATGIRGHFPVKSIGALDKAKGRYEEIHAAEKDLAFPVVYLNASKDREDSTTVLLNHVDEKSIFLPIRKLKKSDK